VLTLVLGGARSGKSWYAQSLLASREAIYVATARRDGDREMRARIEQHRSDRPGSWMTIEEPERVPYVVRTTAPLDRPVLVECLTLWLSNLMLRHANMPARKQQETVLAQVDALAEACRGRDVIVVSNEVGFGVVPATRVGRRFRDLQGWANQRLAREATTVILVVAGLPVALKELDRREVAGL